MLQINPYLSFNGNCREAFEFYRSVFGGEFATIALFKDIPTEMKRSESEDELIMHISLPLDSGTNLMGCDVPESYGQAKFGTSVHLSINTQSKEETEKLFNGLSADGKNIMPLANSFWGAYFGMFTDKFGIQWMISYEYKS